MQRFDANIQAQSQREAGGEAPAPPFFFLSYGDCYETFSQKKFSLDDHGVVSWVQETEQIQTAKEQDADYLVLSGDIFHKDFISFFDIDAV